MKRKMKRLFMAAIWAISLALSAKAHATEAAVPLACEPDACAMAYWGVASANMGDLRSEPSPRQLAEGAAAIAVAKALGGGTERECELIDAVAQFYHRHDERSQDMRLVYYERALSRSRRAHPDDPEIAKRHAVAWKAAWMRASERVEAAYALQTGP